MEIFKRDKYWYYRFELAPINGQRKRKQQGGFRTKKDAEISGVNAQRTYHNTGFAFSPSKISVADYYDIWIKEYCDLNCKRTTVEGYKKRIKNYIKPAIGGYRLCSLTALSLQNLINDMFNKGYSRNTLCSIKGLLTGALDYAVQPLELIQHNPAHSIRLPSPRAVPKIPTRKKDKIPLTKEQLSVIFDRFPEGHPAHLPLQLANRLGLREGEAYALTWDDINFDEGYVNINKQVQMIDGGWTFNPPKYDSYRIVYMDSCLAKLLEREKLRQAENRLEYKECYTHYSLNNKDQLVKSNTGTEVFLLNVREDGSYIQPRTLQHVGRIVHYELGIMTFDYHTLRHTHCTTLYTNGASLLDIKERLGHCDVKTTERYTHNNDELRKRTEKIVEKVYAE